MLGNILYGGYIYGDDLLGVNVAEVAANISNSKSVVIFRSRAVFSSYHTKFRIPGLDINVNLQDPSKLTIPGVAFGAYGNFDEFGTTLYSGIGLHSYARFIAPEVVARGPARVGMQTSAVFHLTHPDDNSIAWSNIGVLDFAIGKDNVAGKMPIDWKGYVYAIEQLGNGNTIIVYGANGITRITPSEVFYSRVQLSKVGIKSKHAVVNTRQVHYFVNANNNLFRMESSGNIVKLGYQEFLSDLGDIVMSYDDYNHLVYICDGERGFVYSEDSDSFGEGPGSVTAIRYQDEVCYVGSPTEVELPEPFIVTDVYDMGTKKEKTIFEIIISANDYYRMMVSVDYRMGSQEEFKTIPYMFVSPHGIAKIPCYGREFRFRIRGNTGNPNFKLYSITVNGVIHGYNFLDTIDV